MIFNITGKHIEITDAIKSHVMNKTEKLPKYYDSINQIEVIIDGGEGGNTSVEVIARAEHSKVFIGKELSADVLTAIDSAVHKLERQLHKHKEKERDNKYAGK